MGQIISLLGILTVLCAVLASMNALKKYTKHGLIIWLSKRHKIFGGVAVILAISHMVLALVNQSFRLTGLLAILTILFTGLFGILFYKLKQKVFYMTHRMLAMMSILFIIIHIVLNSRV